jgi:hypothetical protein
MALIPALFITSPSSFRAALGHLDPSRRNPLQKANSEIFNKFGR